MVFANTFVSAPVHGLAVLLVAKLCPATEGGSDAVRLCSGDYLQPQRHSSESWNPEEPFDWTPACAGLMGWIWRSHSKMPAHPSGSTLCTEQNYGPLSVAPIFVCNRRPTERPARTRLPPFRSHEASNERLACILRPDSSGGRCRVA